MRIIDIFISHSWKYDNQRQRLVNFLDQRNDFNWKDYSVPPDDPLHINGTDEDLYNAIKEQIRQS